MTNIVKSICYNQAPESLRRDIAGILHRVWPDACPIPDENISEAHDKDLNARSFYSYLDGKLVSYAGVVRKTINHDGQTFNIAGLSCVATDPDYQGKGLGLHTVAAATQWIEEQNDIDFGIFTCIQSLAYFYYRAGAWPVTSNVVLIGSQDEGALTSESLDVVVLMRLFSEKARAHESSLSNTTINLDFPIGQFI